VPPPNSAGIILAGGKSRRLGRDKASETLLGLTLLQRAVSALDGLVEEVVVVRSRGQELPQVACSVPLRLVDDLRPDAGPLGGLVTGLVSTDARACLAVACDMPLLQGALLAAILSLLPGHDAVVPVAAGGPQPLCAAYSRSALPVLQKHLDAGGLRLSDAVASLDVVAAGPDLWRPLDPDGLSFINVNSEEDLRSAETRLRSAAGSAARCQVWYGDRRCGRAATHRTQHSGILVCAVDAAVWGSLYEEVAEEDEEE
jgi:molybdopterin-guanine dinucleotide biosynthesis protein A